MGFFAQGLYIPRHVSSTDVKDCRVPTRLASVVLQNSISEWTRFYKEYKNQTGPVPFLEKVTQVIEKITCCTPEGTKGISTQLF